MIPVALQLEYIQSMPLAPISGYKLWVASSTVSLKASEGECPGFLLVSFDRRWLAIKLYLLLAKHHIVLETVPVLPP